MKIVSPLVQKKARLEIIPLIDIMFFLLASFMMVSLNMSKLNAVKVDAPLAVTGDKDIKADVFNIALNKQGEIFIGESNTTLINLGILWQDVGDFARSKANYLESIRLCGSVADTATDPAFRDEAIMGRTRGYVNLATVYFAMGDDGRSRQLLELALKDRQVLLEPDDPT